MFWLWLYTEKNDTSNGQSRKTLFQIFERDLTLLNPGLFWQLFKSIAPPIKEKICISILTKRQFWKLPNQIVSTALNAVSDGDIREKAAVQILQIDQFWKLPNEIVSTALSVIQDAPKSKIAARTILEKRQTINTFLSFRALKTLILSKDKKDLELIREPVLDIHYNLRHGSKKYGRLFYDLLYFPLFYIKEHQNQVLYHIKKYHPKGNRLVKHNIFKIINCYFEYPNQRYFEKEIKALCEDVLQSAVADIEFQYKKHRNDLLFGHIELSLQHPELKDLANQQIKALIAYGNKNEAFQNEVFYKKLKEWEMKKEG